MGNQPRHEMIKDGGSYDIPLGCLLLKNVSNLLVAGR
ncbi:MAG: FAD-dependent oxidoreductase [Pseudomonadota bacterium]